METNLVIIIPLFILYVIIAVEFLRWQDNRLFRKSKRILRGEWKGTAKEYYWLLQPTIIFAVLTLTIVLFVHYWRLL